jgi:hypothetical protein
MSAAPQTNLEFDLTLSDIILELKDLCKLRF